VVVRRIVSPGQGNTRHVIIQGEQSTADVVGGVNKNTVTMSQESNNECKGEWGVELDDTNIVKGTHQNRRNNASHLLLHQRYIPRGD
jgi:hypothetical protein